MKNNANKTVAAYPQFLEFVDQSYGASVLRLFIKLDQLLCNKFPDYVPGSFYNELLVVFPGQMEGKKNLRIGDEMGKALLKALFFTCKEVSVTANFMIQNPEIKDLFIKLQNLFTNVSVMIQLQDSFDDLNKLPIHTN